MSLWELACYFAVFLGGAAGGWITCAVFTSAKVQELGSECAQLQIRLDHLRNSRITVRVREPELEEPTVVIDATVAQLVAHHERWSNPSA